MKTLTIRRPNKSERERKVLIGLVELFLEEGKPVGSNTLKDNGFEDLSSATIRNYFAKLEEEGYLLQQHSSGGRIPTAKAYKLYADAFEAEPFRRKDFEWSHWNKREVTEFLHLAAETLSEQSGLATFLSTPVFEMDFIQHLRLMPLDDQRLLCVLITDFGLIRTEVLYLPEKFETDSLALIQDYFYWRMNKKEKPSIPQEKTLKWAQRLYNELMVRHVVDSSNTQSQNLFKTGLSKLLNYPEFSMASQLANGLALFENPDQMQKLLRLCTRKNELTYLIGDDLTDHVNHTKDCSVIMIPYYIHQTIAGAIGVLGPTRIDYRELFRMLKNFSEQITEILTQNVYTFKISYKSSDVKTEKNLDLTSSILLEDKSN